MCLFDICVCSRETAKTIGFLLNMLIRDCWLLDVGIHNTYLKHLVACLVRITNANAGVWTIAPAMESNNKRIEKWSEQEERHTSKKKQQQQPNTT